jgi:hypothetical protein
LLAFADAREDHRAESLALVAQQTDTHERAHRVAEEVGPLDAKLIHHAQHVARHGAIAVRRLLARLVASAVPATVERDHAADRTQGVHPAGLDPMALQIRAPAVDEHDRSARTEALIVDPQTIRCDKAHREKPGAISRCRLKASALSPSAST